MKNATATQEVFITDKTCKIAAILANVHNCDYYIEEEGASAEIIKNLLRMAIGCYGKDYMLQAIADCGDKAAKKYIKLIEKL